MTGTANVSVYLNVTSHWTSLAVLRHFEGRLTAGAPGIVFTHTFSTPVVVGLSVVLAFMCTIKDDDCTTIGFLVWDRWSCISHNDLLKTIYLQ